MPGVESTWYIKIHLGCKGLLILQNLEASILFVYTTI
jgi:hypothetical protein